MSKPRYIWWGYVKAIVREYPKLKKELQQLQAQRITGDLSRMAGGGAYSRSTENAALRQLSPAKQANYDAVTKAIEQTMRLPNGAERLKLIDMVFWKQSHTLSGAAYAMSYSYTSVATYHKEFLRMVGFNRGLEDVSAVCKVESK